MTRKYDNAVMPDLRPPWMAEVRRDRRSGPSRHPVEKTGRRRTTLDWIPAFAGMTSKVGRNDNAVMPDSFRHPVEKTGRRRTSLDWIPAFAGMTSKVERISEQLPRFERVPPLFHAPWRSSSIEQQAL